MLLWDTGCSDQLIHPECAQMLIARGAHWRFCEPLAMQHGNKDATRPAPPATKQVCVEVFCTHQGHKFKQEDVWFYVYDGALQDAMLSDEFLRTIPCITEPGRKLLDTSSHAGDETAVRDYASSLRRDYDSIVDHHMCAARSVLPQSSHVNVALGGDPTSTPPPPASGSADSAPHSSERIKALLAEMAAQRERLRERLGKPVSQEALARATSDFTLPPLAKSNVYISPSRRALKLITRALLWPTRPAAP